METQTTEKLTIPQKSTASRKAFGLTRHQMADAIGVNHETVKKWEQGKRNIRDVELADWASALGINLTYFTENAPLIYPSVAIYPPKVLAVATLLRLANKTFQEAVFTAITSLKLSVRNIFNAKEPLP